MTVETGDFIADLDPTAPADSQPLGEVNEHVQLVKRVLDTTFAGSAGDLYDDTSGPVFVGPVQTNRQPADIEALALEVGLDLDNTGAASRIDDLEATRIVNDAPVVITESWAFTGPVEFLDPVDFSGPVPTIASVDIATVDQLASYYERSKLQFTQVSSDYGTDANDLGKKIIYTGPGAHTITINGGAEEDTIFITNANTAAQPENAELTIIGGAGEAFQRGDGQNSTSFTVTGRWRTVGLHKVNNAWQVTGDYD